MKTLDHSAQQQQMDDNSPSLKIRIHGVDGSIATFDQYDHELINRTLDELNPLRILGQSKIAIAGNHSVTSFIPPLITRIDVITDWLSVWDYPFIIGALQELTEAEFKKYLPERQRPLSLRSLEDFPMFLDLEMVNGQELFLWMQVVAGLPTEQLVKIYSLLKKGSLIFGLRSGGIGILNPANIVRFTVHPDPLKKHLAVKPAHQASGLRSDRPVRDVRGSVGGSGHWFNSGRAAGQMSQNPN